MTSEEPRDNDSGSAEGQQVDGTGFSDTIEVEVKGPDPEVWGEDEERPVASTEAEDPTALDYDEIRDEGTDDEVKGPAAEVWAERHEIRARPEEGEGDEG